MISWLSFWIIIFWFIFILFFFNPFYFLALLVYSELVWVVLYCISVLVVSHLDESSLLSLSFFIFGLAGLEFSLGFILVIFFKSHNLTMAFNSLSSKNAVFANNALFSLRK